MRLPEVDPAVFEIYLAWLNTGEVDNSITGTLENRDPTRMDTQTRSHFCSDGTNGTNLLLACYRLGDEVQDVGFQNAVTDKYISYVEEKEEIPCDDCIALVCKLTRANSTLMRLCVDYAAFDLEHELYDKSVDGWSEQFVKMVAKAHVRDYDMEVEERRPKNRRSCFYHEHPEGKGRTNACFSSKWGKAGGV